MEPITKHEIAKVLSTANPYKAPGIDGLPMIVWQKLWPELQGKIYGLFKASIYSAQLPAQWKDAKMIPKYEKAG